MERLMLRPKEAADATGISRSKFYQLLARGEIHSEKVGGMVRVPVEELRASSSPRWLGDWRRPDGTQRSPAACDRRASERYGAHHEAHTTVSSISIG